MASINDYIRFRSVPTNTPGVNRQILEVDPDAPPEVQEAVRLANQTNAGYGGNITADGLVGMVQSTLGSGYSATPGAESYAPVNSVTAAQQAELYGDPEPPPPVSAPSVPVAPPPAQFNPPPIAPSVPSQTPVQTPTVPPPVAMGMMRSTASTPQTASLPTMNTPEGMRDLYSEGANTLQAQIALAPDQWAAYNEWAPKYVNTDLNLLRNSLFGSVDVGQFFGLNAEGQPTRNTEFWQGYQDAGGWGAGGGQQWLDQAVNTSTYLDQAAIQRGGGLMGINQALTQAASEQSQRANTAQRTADLNDVRNLGGMAQQLYQDANPQLYGYRNVISDRALQGVAPTAAYNQMAGIAQQGFAPLQSGQIRDVGSNFAMPTVGAPNSYNNVRAATSDAGLQSAMGSLGYTGSDIQRTLEQQALQGLQLGRGLSAEETRDATQAAREAFAARGLINSNAAIGQEVLNRDAVARQREAERRAFAQSVDATGFGQRQQGFANALGYSNAAQNYAGMGLQADLANQGMGLNYAQLGLNAGMANQQAQLATNQLNQQGALANQQADITRNNQALQYGDFNRQGLQQQFANLGYVDQAEMQRRQFEDQRLQQAFQNFAGTSFDPYQGVLGRTSANQGTNAGIFGTSGATTGQLGNVYNQTNPFNSYASDLYNTNFNADQANKISGRNNRSALWGSFMSMLGGIVPG
ncbi:MAG TPA: hypothetical protein VEC57_00045 [Candidatus Limnocylindrales bacterium]|nr:hypothetical protein [Candidatus Limnocylindrales bacterium]